MYDGYEISENTYHRKKILEFFASTSHSKRIVLWLTDASVASPALLTSYSLGLERLEQGLKGTRVPLPEETVIDDEYLLTQVFPKLNQLLLKSGIEPTEFKLKALWSKAEFFEESVGKTTEQLVGVVAFDGRIGASTGGEKRLILSLIAHQIESGRAERFVNAVSETKDVLEGRGSNVDEKLTNLARLVARSIGASECLYRNTNTNPAWALSVKQNGRWSLSSIADDTIGQSDETLDQRLEQASKSVDAHIASQSESLIVPISQISYILTPHSFTSTQTIIEKFEKTDADHIAVGFQAKQVSGYLQSIFSSTDRKIAKAVLDYTEKFVQSNLFDENYSEIIKFLRENVSSSSINPEKMLQLFQRLSINFVNVFEIDIDGVNLKSEVAVEPAIKDNELKGSYLSRLKEGYLSKYYSLDPEHRSAEILMGVDKTKGGFDLEFHLPSAMAASKIYVLRYKGEVISESVVKAVFHFFHEFYVRIKKDENNDDRATYLMQVRHTFLQHMSAANTSISAMYDRWAKGRRSSTYWSVLAKDPIYPKLMNKLLWSLQQAQLLLDNGRYTMGDIEDLNKKPFNLEGVIDDCLKIFEDQKAIKGLHTFQKIAGQRPTVLNGDEALLTIAFMNLFDNAFKYSPKGGRIGYRIDYKKDRYRFEITSAGPCLDRNKKSLYFQLGVRGKQSDNLNPRHGSGLGLAIAYKILKEHSEIAELDFYPTEYDQDFGSSTNTFCFEMPYRTGLTNEGGA